jgi:hypothetical protein
MFAALHSDLSYADASCRPVWDTYDEIAQYKLIYGLMSGLLVWTFCVLLNLSLAPVSFVGVPIILWLSLRWYAVCACPPACS